MKIIWVTGASGQVGRAIRQLTTAQNYVFLSHEQLDICDIQSLESFAAISPPAVIINLAAFTKVDHAENRPDIATAVNHWGTANLAKISKLTGALLIHLSTDYVHDGEKTEAYVETDDANPLQIYGLTKLSGERAIQTITSTYIILRTSWVFSEVENNFVSTMYNLASDRAEVSVVADQIGGPTGASSIARCLVMLAEQWEKFARSIPCGLYHFAGQPYVSWANFADQLFTEIQRQTKSARRVRVIPIAAKDYPATCLRPRNSMLDCSKFVETFGWNDLSWMCDLEQAVSRLISSERIG